MSHCFFDISINNLSGGRIEFELFDKDLPKTCANFRALCTGEKGFGYKPSLIFAITQNRSMIGGDFIYQNGTGGKSIYGDNFDCENFKYPFTGPGDLAMINDGKGKNASKFMM